MGGYPQAQDVGAQRAVDLFRFDDVAKGLGHLSSLLVHGEAVGENAPVGRAVIHAHGSQQAGLEPAAVLVGAFQVQVRRHGHLVPHRAHHVVTEAGIEPDVHDVGHGLVYPRIVPQHVPNVANVANVALIPLVPGVDAVLLNDIGHS